ncbi:transketolase [Candidatus Endolissoclinum faulkneri L5]|uniref:Transketolase n=1 Tax=Candidatus Endolissoclinum faulkneri L5 TaxID=1401328 RepID=V9TSN0_9PROT|nr:transketolase [Candidatus Endolissoclinum faulkneri]AHC73924.1 transketolase [Candidatus Endolissoclinum faulkneri L5]
MTTSSNFGVALSEEEHLSLSNAISVLSMDAVEKAQSGHPGMPMGMSDVAVVLFSQFLRFDPRHPDWADRDRFILSAGHGSMLLYSLLYLTGYKDLSLEELKNFRRLGYKTAGHPEYGALQGVETTTGPLGQGFANAVGMAIAERHLNVRFGDDLIDHRVWVVASDGCLMEGLSHEAASLAGHLGLGRMNVLWDDNKISIDGSTDLTSSDDVQERFLSYGWHVVECDGHDPKHIACAIREAASEQRPSLIDCRTIIGCGAPTKAGKSISHGAPLGKEEVAAVRAAINWSHPPFVIPEDISKLGLSLGNRGAKEFDCWTERLLNSSKKENFNRSISGVLPASLTEAVNAHKKSMSINQPRIATRVSSQKILEVIVPILVELLGGSADLSSSNNTKVDSQELLNRNNYGGRYIHYGVREHAMVAAINGMALHKGVIPYGGTFLVFTDYCRPSIRLAALMGIRCIFIMTHDSIGLGEDGPTHQPVEHLSSLRAIPNLVVFRPADAVETAEAWQLALQRRSGPSILALTRQNVPTVRVRHSEFNLSSKGGYVLANAKGERRASIIASGSEIEIAIAAKAQLDLEGIHTAVVSVPSLDLFMAQEPFYINHVFGSSVRVVVEAGVRQCWDRFLGDNDAFIGMSGFGASGSCQELYRHFKITVSNIVNAVKERI